MEEGEHGQTLLSTRCRTVVIVGFMEMVTYNTVFMVGFFVVTNMATISKADLT